MDCEIAHQKIAACNWLQHEQNWSTLFKHKNIEQGSLSSTAFGFRELIDRTIFGTKFFERKSRSFSHFFIEVFACFIMIVLSFMGYFNIFSISIMNNNILRYYNNRRIYKKYINFLSLPCFFIYITSPSSTTCAMYQHCSQFSITPFTLKFLIKRYKLKFLNRNGLTWTVNFTTSSGAGGRFGTDSIWTGSCSCLNRAPWTISTQRRPDSGKRFVDPVSSDLGSSFDIAITITTPSRPATFKVTRSFIR